MRAYDYIIKKIDEIVSKFKDTKVIYQYDKDELSHYIKVIPSKIYSNNIKYIELETEIIVEFINKFPNEEITFITENDLIDIEPDKVTYFKTGELYNEKITANLYNWNYQNAILLDLNFNMDIGENNLSSFFNEIFNVYYKTIDDNTDNQINPLYIEPSPILTDDDFPLAA